LKLNQTPKLNVLAFKRPYHTGSFMSYTALLQLCNSVYYKVPSIKVTTIIVPTIMVPTIWNRSHFGTQRNDYRGLQRSCSVRVRISALAFCFLCSCALLFISAFKKLFTETSCYHL